MIYYLIPYLILIISTPFYKKFNHKLKKIIFFFSLTPAFFLATFRGNVGTDTASYLEIIKDFIKDPPIILPTDAEFLFYLSINTLSFLTHDNKIILLILTAIYCLTYFLAFSKSKEDIILSSLLIFPLFFYDSSMNGIRYGISFALAKIAYDAKNNKQIKTSFIALFLSFSFHLSGLLLFLLLITSKISFKKIIIAASFLIFFTTIHHEYLIEKIIAYSTFNSPNKFSGLSLLLIAVITFIYTLFFHKNLFSQITTQIIFVLFSFILSTYSYAGLRLLGLTIYATFILQINFSKTKETISTTQYSFLLLISVICFIVKMRHFLLYSDGSSPFIPYEFINLS